MFKSLKSITFGVVAAALMAGVAHADVEVAVGAELDAAAGVDVGGAGELDDRPGRLGRVVLQVGRRPFLGNTRDDPAVHCDLMLDEIATVLTKMGMECDPQQPDRRSGSDLAAKISPQ